VPVPPAAPPPFSPRSARPPASGRHATLAPNPAEVPIPHHARAPVDGDARSPPGPSSRHDWGGCGRRRSSPGTPPQAEMPAGSGLESRFPGSASRRSNPDRGRRPARATPAAGGWWRTPGLEERAGGRRPTAASREELGFIQGRASAEPPPSRRRAITEPPQIRGQAAAEPPQIRGRCSAVAIGGRRHSEGGGPQATAAG